jgi:hypothetical protein
MGVLIKSQCYDPIFGKNSGSLRKNANIKKMAKLF